MILDYVTLKVIWYVIFCVIIIAFLVTAGMDIGVNFLLPVVGKSDYDRRLVINATGPTWEGNQVWLILFVAGMLAIWPPLYAALLYSMYFLCLFLVFSLILRPPGFDYRNKINSHAWRLLWDMSLFVGSIIITLSIGILIADVFSGSLYYFDSDMRPIFIGSVYKLISPLSLLCFISVLCLVIVQGGLYLQYKLQDIPAQLARRATQIAGWIFIVGFVITGIYVGFWLPAYKITSIPDLNSGFLPGAKHVVISVAGWSNNFVENKFLWIFPLLTIVGVRSAMRASIFNRPVLGLVINSVGILCGVVTVAIAVFPFMLTSSLNPNDSITIWDGSASQNTLWYALIAVVIFLPIVLAYTAWVYRVMRGKVKLQHDSY